MHSIISWLFRLLFSRFIGSSLVSLCRIGGPLLAPYLDFFWFVLFYCGVLTIETLQTHQQSIQLLILVRKIPPNTTGSFVMSPKKKKFLAPFILFDQCFMALSGPQQSS
jgi:hypothetical protein